MKVIWETDPGDRFSKVETMLSELSSHTRLNKSSVLADLSPAKVLDFAAQLSECSRLDIAADQKQKRWNGFHFVSVRLPVLQLIADSILLQIICHFTHLLDFCS